MTLEIQNTYHCYHLLDKSHCTLVCAIFNHPKCSFVVYCGCDISTIFKCRTLALEDKWIKRPVLLLSFL